MPISTPQPGPVMSKLISVQKDTYVLIQSKNTRVLVPAGSAYQTDYEWQISIYPTKNLIYSMCWGCQPIGDFSVCGESYGITGEGNCDMQKISLSDWTLDQYSFTDTKKFAFIAVDGTDNPGKSAIDYASVHTVNKQYPTLAEKQIIQKILSGISKTD